MVSQTPSSPVLIVGNYCHDVLLQNGTVVGESLGGASSFIAAVLDGLSIPSNLISLVGRDFKYPVDHPPIVTHASKTTAFHAYFDSGVHSNGHQDRILKRVCVCDPIKPSDLPEGRFNFGMAVGVAGEILPETLERMIEICDVVLVDIQALIRDFDEIDGTVKLVHLEKTRFYPLLPRIGVLKVSSEEAVYMDVEVVKNWCCVLVTNGEDGCRVHWRDGNLGISPFMAKQEDPTGAGDSFLGGLVAGLVQRLAVPDAALLGNFFGSLTVEQIGLPKFDSRLLQRVKDEVEKRKRQFSQYERSDDELKFVKPAGHETFHSSLCAAKLLTPTPCSIQQTQVTEQQQPKLAGNCLFGETIQTLEGKP